MQQNEHKKEAKAQIRGGKKEAKVKIMYNLIFTTPSAKYM